MGCFEGADPKSSKNDQAYQFLVGVMLSVQTRDEITHRVVRRLINDGVTLEKYNKLSEKEIFEKIKDINFNSKKAHYIKNATTQIMNEFDGIVPNTLKDIIKLKGVGKKVGNLAIQAAYGKVEGVAVDVHVHRISNRIGWVSTKNPDHTCEALNELFDSKYYIDLNHQLVGLGQTICYKNKPKCGDCPISLDCDFGIDILSKKDESKDKKRTKKGLKKNSGKEDEKFDEDDLSKKSTQGDSALIEKNEEKQLMLPSRKRQRAKRINDFE